MDNSHRKYLQKMVKIRERQLANAERRLESVDELPWPWNDQEALETAKRHFEQGYRFEIDFETVHSVESVDHFTKSAFAYVGVKASNPKGEEVWVEPKWLWIGDIASLQSGDVQPLFEGADIALDMADNKNGEFPSWLQLLADSQADDAFFFHLHVLSTHGENDDES